MYRLNHRKNITGFGKMYRPLFESEDLSAVKEKLKKHVLDGIPLYELSITKDVEFEFRCAVQILEDQPDAN